MSELIKTIVVDDHSLFRECVVRSLLESGCFDVVAQSDSHVDALEKVARHTPDIVLLDISLPGGGIGTAKEIAERVPDTKVIMLTVSEAEDDVQDALLAYAKAYVLKGIPSGELVPILQKINSGESYIPPNLAVGLLKRSQQDAYAFDLNRREKQILEKLADGLSNRVIAETIHLSEKTVKLYMTQIMHKLHVSNRAQAALKVQEMSRDENK